MNVIDTEGAAYVVQGSWTVICLLLLSGCASLEGPRWVLLGDTSEQAFFVDRQNVRRQPNGSYRYFVKTRPYQEQQPHEQDESHDTSTVLLVEMDCQKKQWTAMERSVVDQNDKVLFRYTSPLSSSQPIRSDIIHFAAYNYLCRGSDIIAQHNH